MSQIIIQNVEFSKKLKVGSNMLLICFPQLVSVNVTVVEEKQERQKKKTHKQKFGTAWPGSVIPCKQKLHYS